MLHPKISDMMHENASQSYPRQTSNGQMCSRSSSPAAEAPNLLRRKSSGFLDAWLSSSQSRDTPSLPDDPPSSSPGPSAFNLLPSSPCTDASIIQPPAKRIKITAENGWKMLPKRTRGKVNENGQDQQTNTGECSSEVKAEKLAPSRRKSAVGVKKLRAKAKLSALPELPLDVLLEIFSHLHPADLLHLARTTKALRALLMRKMTIGVWRAALESVPDLPPCPDDMSVPVYVNLIFDPHCHNCLANNVKNISFLLRVRYCTRCVKEKLMPVNNFPEGTKGGALIKRAVAFAPMGANGIEHCSIKEHDEFLSEVRTLSEGRLQFAERKIGELRVRKSHAKKCHNWLNNQTSAREKELKTTRRDRARAIEQKLIDLGFRPELEFLSEINRGKIYLFPAPNLIKFKEHPSIKQNKPLTERVWTNIKPIMEDYMGQVRQHRIDNDIESFIQTWMTSLCSAYYKWRTHLTILQKYPAGTDIPILSLPDFLALPAVRQIYEKSEVIREWQTLDIASRAPSPARQEAIIKAKLQRVQIFLETKMEDEIWRWQRQSLLELYYQFEEKRPSFTEEKILFFIYHHWYDTDAEVLAEHKKTMELAIMVFKCKNHSVHIQFEEEWADDEDSWMIDNDAMYKRRLLWFPEVLHHPCQGLTRCSWQERQCNAYPHLMVGPDSPNMRRVPWDVETLEFDEQASKTVKCLLDACGEAEPNMTWWKVTAAEMDKRDDRFACLKCSFGEKCDGMRPVKVYSWRDAVVHNVIAHFGDSSTKFELLSPEDAEKARKMQRTLVAALTHPSPSSTSNTQNVANVAAAAPNPLPVTTPSMFSHTTTSPNTVVIPPISQTAEGPRAKITTVYGTDQQGLYLPDAKLKLYRCAACLDKPGVNLNRRMTRVELKTHLDTNSGLGNHVDLDDVEPVWKWEDEGDEEMQDGERVKYHIGFTPEEHERVSDEPMPKWRPVKGLHYYDALDRGSGRPLPIVKMVPGVKAPSSEENDMS